MEPKARRFRNKEKWCKGASIEKKPNDNNMYLYSSICFMIAFPFVILFAFLFFFSLFIFSF